MPTWIDILIRSVVFLVLLFLITKGLGKKQMSQLNIFQYITGIVIGSVVAITITDPTTNPVYGILALAVWFLLPITVEFLSIKSKSFRNFFQGKETILIQDGKILEDNLKKERLTIDDLLGELRSNQFFNASDVEFAVLEPKGKVNILPKKENQPVTPKILGQQATPEKEPQTIIMDGSVLLEPLSNASLNKEWLEAELAKQDVSLENVFLGQVDSDGQLTIDLYDDQLTPAEPTEKPLLLASMKKCQADLEVFALATNNQHSKQLYNNNSKRMQQAIDYVNHHLE
ncbi:DUF421 domain-containing protein [Barrientosiimonas marina]|uniref:DUF421 domain-containing protein n=1 Tax=Lentibacillus kimchii TaxID=1542911 RepID=A0ABW2URB5_9BACI